MKDPCGAVVRSLVHRFEDIGFTLLEDRDYAIAFTDGSRVLKLTVEPNYPDDIELVLTETGDNTYPVASLMQILDPRRFTSFRRSLKAVRRKHRAGGSDAYFAITQPHLSLLLDFLRARRAILFDPKAKWRKTYDRRRRALDRIAMRRAGVDPVTLRRLGAVQRLWYRLVYAGR